MTKLGPEVDETQCAQYERERALAGLDRAGHLPLVVSRERDVVA